MKCDDGARDRNMGKALRLASISENGYSFDVLSSRWFAQWLAMAG